MSSTEEKLKNISKTAEKPNNDPSSSKTADDGPFIFVQPPAAPIFHPTEREFEDPLQYISQIRHLAEKAGMCKIVPPRLIPTEMVETEFWRLLASLEEEVIVEYGTDLSSIEYGSGFPHKSTKDLSENDEQYAYSPWNLNNLPTLDDSVLNYVNDDIVELKVPWMSVGMCFSAFCWHIEDHWTNSISYMHWGEPRTWYSIPSEMAARFEGVLKDLAPRLLSNHPEFMHQQLFTMFNPNILMANNVPVFRMDQKAGEFIVTFPRCYNAGFNLGYNFSEAVNFGNGDWLKYSRECADHYTTLCRPVLFSHDQLLCTMAVKYKQLSMNLVYAVDDSMRHLIELETTLRRNLKDAGVERTACEVFELLPFQQRQCTICKTICFLSAITCICCPNVMVCGQHVNQLCECSSDKYTLHFRYTLDNLSGILSQLTVKRRYFTQWLHTVQRALNGGQTKSLTLPKLSTLLDEALAQNISNCPELLALNDAVIDGEKCEQLLQRLDIAGTRSRHGTYASGTKTPKYKLSIEELEQFNVELNNLACTVVDGHLVKELLDAIKIFQSNSQCLLDKNIRECSINELEQCIDQGKDICVELSNMHGLNVRLRQIEWLTNVIDYKRSSRQMGLKEAKHLLNTGVQLPPHLEITREINELDYEITTAENWERRAKKALSDTDSNLLKTVERLLSEANHISLYLPTEDLLYNATIQAQDWLRQMSNMHKAKYYPYLADYEDLINKGRDLIMHLCEVNQLDLSITAAQGWHAKINKTFMRKKSTLTLMESLSPHIANFCHETASVLNLNSEMDPKVVSRMFRDAESIEVAQMRRLRAQNLSKPTTEAATKGEHQFCVCKQSAYGLMMQCELCKDWFHASCVKLPKVPVSKVKLKAADSATLHLLFREHKFLCLACCRTKRPRLEVVLMLLMSLQKLNVRLPEGEALQYLTERAMTWQERAKKLMHTHEFISAKLHSITIGRKYAAALASGDYQMINELVTEELRRSTSTYNDYHLDEHAYSLSTARINDEYHLRMSATLRLQIENLLFEGDLLEVQIDELVQLWKVLQATRNYLEEPILINFGGDNKCRRSRKRKISNPPLNRDTSLDVPAKSMTKSKRLSTSGDLKAKIIPLQMNAEKLKKNKIKIAVRLKKAKPKNKKFKLKLKKVIQGKTKKRAKKNVKKLLIKSESAKKRNIVDDANDENMEDKCATKDCFLPIGDNVDWVQCDGGCDMWFHMACVGLTANDISKDDDYICMSCTSKSTVVTAPHLSTVFQYKGTVLIKRADRSGPSGLN